MVNIPSGDFYIGDGTRGSSGYGFSDVNPYPAKLITTAIQSAGLGAASNYQFNSWRVPLLTYQQRFLSGMEDSFYCMEIRNKPGTICGSISQQFNLRRNKYPPLLLAPIRPRDL